MNQTFFDKWKVFIFGLIGSIAVSLQQLLSDANHSQDTKVYLFAALMAALSFIATEWRGKNVSITGILGTLAGVFVTMQSSGTFTWAQFVISAVLAILAAVSPPPKPSTYETSAEIVKAKEIPPVEQTKDDSVLPKGPAN